MNRKFIKKSKGFTLVETLVAIAILSMAIAPALYTAHQSIVAVNLARDQMIASYLAQDAMDYLIAKKNQNIIVCSDKIDRNTKNFETHNEENEPNANCNKPNSRERQYGRYWLAHLDDCDATSNGSKNCELDTTRRTTPADPFTYPYPSTCVTGGTASDCYLYFDSQRSMYRPSDVASDASFAAPTKFKRYVNYKKILGANSNGDETEVTVTVVVAWKSSGLNAERNVTLRSNLFNYKP